MDGATLGGVWAVPFVGLLLSIAVLPLVAPGLWHHHYGKVTAAWALAFLVPFALTQGAEVAIFEFLYLAPHSARRVVLWMHRHPARG